MSKWTENTEALREVITYGFWIAIAIAAVVVSLDLYYGRKRNDRNQPR